MNFYQTFRIDGDHFALDGKPFQILSGEMMRAKSR